jgi:hypothetical protein
VIAAEPAGEKGAAQGAYFGKRVAVVGGSDVPGGNDSDHAIPTKTIREQRCT